MLIAPTVEESLMQSRLILEQLCQARAEHQWPADVRRRAGPQTGVG
jgi:hypothetical protein